MSEKNNNACEQPFIEIISKDSILKHSKGSNSTGAPSPADILAQIKAQEKE